jgi:uncharacterized protein YdhG (YjbR/CyaY superfamily)
MQIKAASPTEYMARIPADRRPHIERLRRLVRKAVPRAEESIVWGMLGYCIGERPFVCIASQKNYISLYLCDIASQPALRKKYEKALKGLKMGKSCINFTDVATLPLDTIEAILREAPTVVVKSGTMAKRG